MLRRIRELFNDVFRQADLVLLALCIGASLFGILMIASATHYMHTSKLVLVQAAALCIGAVLYIVVSQVDLNELAKYWKWIFLVGVVFILFSSGLETDFGELKKSGLAATAIACAGVIVPIALGTIGALCFMGGFGAAADADKLLNALFVGCILAATSVGITVETLRELGKLSTRVGTTVLSAAIIDDVIGIIALSLLTGLKGGGNIGLTLLKAVGFFVFTVGIGLLLRLLFKWLVKKYPHKRRTSIFAFAMCLIYAYCAEKFFGIAAITGGYMAGLMLSGLADTSFVDRKVIVSGYMIFTPIFFAYIGISADFGSFQLADLGFALVFVLLGVIGKIVGCGGVARLFKFNGRESATIGCGMIARGEVALAVYAAGRGFICEGGIDPLVATIFLILCSSILCPVLLKLCFRDKHDDTAQLDKEYRSTIASEALENLYHGPEEQPEPAPAGK